MVNYEIPPIEVYKKGNMIVVWFDRTYHQYWDYSIREAVKLFKKKTGIHGGYKRRTFCPFIFG